MRGQFQILPPPPQPLFIGGAQSFPCLGTRLNYKRSRESHHFAVDDEARAVSTTVRDMCEPAVQPASPVQNIVDVQTSTSHYFAVDTHC